MEAVPRLPMISFILKESPEPTSFGPKLKQYIHDFYHEDPESYNNEIHQLENLRASAIRAPVNINGCSLLKKYYCQLHFLQSRFPMGKDGAAAVTFTWRDVFANMVYTLPNIRFEIVSILYNIGAIHTQLGAHAERTNAEGMKMACTHFQCAAWAFEHLKSNYPQPGVDLAPELMTLKCELCLAQAQECLLEKSMLDNRKPTIVAKVAKQIVDYYSLALTTLEQTIENLVTDSAVTRLFKGWKRYVKFKRAYHLAVTHLYQGLAAEEHQKMGERVAFYNASLTALNEARTIYGNGKTSFTGMSGEKEAIEEALTFTNDVIEGKRKAAKNENEYIYHEEVPDKDALPTVQGASLVKGISFSVDDPEVSGPDIFARLVPMKVHEASSLYSEEKAKILRSVGAKIEERDRQLNIYLASLKLEHMNLWDTDEVSNSENSSIPDEVVERCAALNAKPNAIQDLVDAMRKLSDTYHDVEVMLKDINALLSEEQLKENQYQEVVGKRPPSIVATDFTREAKKYEEAHAKACESNQALHRAMTMHINNLKILAQPLTALMNHIPSIKPCLTGQYDDIKPSEIEAEKKHTKELKRILSKVDEMRKQRADLYTKLRDAIAQDDVTRLLVTATAESENLDRLFAEQINKHQALVNLIDQNLAAQDNILTALTDAYAQTATVRKVTEELLKRRESTISSLITSYDAYEDLLAKSLKGLEFYRKLEINVSKLLQRVKSACKVQEEERVQILAQNSTAKNTSTDNMDKSNRSFTDSQSTPSSGGNLKLKDYLNNRVINMTTYQDRRMVASTAVVSVATDVSTTISSGKQKNTFIKDMIISKSGNVDQSTSGYRYQPETYVPYNMDSRQSPYITSYAYPDESGASNSGDQQFPGTNRITCSSDPVSLTDSQIMPYPSDTNSQNQYASVTQAYQHDNVITGYMPFGMHSTPQENPAYPVHNAQGYAQSQSNLQVTTFNSYQMPSDKEYIKITSQNQAAIGYNPLSTSYGQNQLPQQQQQIQSPQQQIQHSHQQIQPPQQMQPVQQQVQLSQQQQQQLQQPQPQSISNIQTQNTCQIATSQSYGSAEMPQGSTSSPSLHHVQTPTPVINYQGIENQQYLVQEQYIPNQYSGVNVPVMQHNLPNVNDPLQWQNSMQQQQINYSPSIHNNYNEKMAQTGIYVQSGQAYQKSYGNYQAVDYGSNPDIIQSHTKANSQIYPQNYYITQNQYVDGVQYQYCQDYNAQNANVDTSYKGHPGYAYDPVAGNYQYSSGYQDSRTMQVSEANGLSQPVPYSVEQISFSRYTNASSNVVTNQTTSSEYSGQNCGNSLENQAYYTTQYGLQTQAQGTSTAIDSNRMSLNQTYMQASNNETNTTSSRDAGSSEQNAPVAKQESNIDLLSDLDITINQAPLVPQVPSVQKIQKEDSDENDKCQAEKTSENNCFPAKEEKNDDSLSRVDDKHENLQIIWDTWYTDVQPKKDPLGDPQLLQKFIIDIEKYEKFVDSLLVKTLSGATNLDIKWKEVQDLEEREKKKQTTSAAEMNSSRNRFTNYVPYDSSKVELNELEGSSYINASHVKDITQWTPVAFIITQAPTPDTYVAFWTLVWEQESEVIACLLSDAQLNNDIYWPTSKEQELKLGPFTIKLKNQINHAIYVQRVFSISHPNHKTDRDVVHMQFLMWPPSGFPSSPGPMLTFATDVMSEQALRRCSPKPIVVHCLEGGPLSGLFLLSTAAVCQVRAGRGVVDIPLVLSSILKFRKGLLNKDFLFFGYKMALYHAQDTLMKRGILSSTKATFECFEEMKKNKDKSVRKMHPSDDFLHNLRGSGLQRNANIHQGNDQAISRTPSSSQSTFQGKPEGTKPKDPLSELDPLWSIRR